MAHSFKTVENLQAASFTPQQAQAQALAQTFVAEESQKDFVTKGYLDQVITQLELRLMNQINVQINGLARQLVTWGLGYAGLILGGVYFMVKEMR